jgi:hypothetical protein
MLHPSLVELVTASERRDMSDTTAAKRIAKAKAARAGQAENGGGGDGRRQAMARGQAQAEAGQERIEESRKGRTQSTARGACAKKASSKATHRLKKVEARAAKDRRADARPAVATKTDEAPRSPKPTKPAAKKKAASPPKKAAPVKKRGSKVSTPRPRRRVQPMAQPAAAESLEPETFELGEHDIP